MTITWNQISGAHGYKIYRSTKKDSGYRKVKTVNDKTTLTYTDKKLSVGKKYYYKVCGISRGVIISPVVTSTVSGTLIGG